VTITGSAIVPASTFTIFPAGTPITGAVAGDLVLVAHSSIMARLIRFGQRIRYRGVLRPFAWANHAAITVSTTQLVEQQARGGTLVMLADYAAKDVALVRIDYSPDQLAEVVNFSRWTLGIGYGWLSIAGVVWDLLTGFHLSVGSGLRMICSAASSRALEHGGIYTPDRLPEAVMPADLCRYFGVTLP
jgi:hypothetical protein